MIRSGFGFQETKFIEMRRASSSNIGGGLQFRAPHSAFRNQRLTGTCKELGNGGATKPGTTHRRRREEFLTEHRQTDFEIRPVTSTPVTSTMT